MPIATTTILAAAAVGGLGLSAYGMYESKQGKDQQVAGAMMQSKGAQLQAFGATQQSQGALTQVEGATQQNAANKQIIGLEMQQEEQRRLAMEIDARRSVRQTVRQAQVAQAQGLTAATHQGAGFGSGLQGAYGQISGDRNTSILGIGQNLAIGRALFGINTQISQQKLAYAGGQDTINSGSRTIAEGSGIIAQGAGIIAQGGGVSAQGAGLAATGEAICSVWTRYSSSIL
jgi:hypothetical protein